MWIEIVMFPGHFRGLIGPARKLLTRQVLAATIERVKHCVLEVRMELPGILKQLVAGHGEGFIELCPQEYDMGNLTEMIEEVLEECEVLFGAPAGQPVPASGE